MNEIFDFIEQRPQVSFWSLIAASWAFVRLAEWTLGGLGL